MTLLGSFIYDVFVKACIRRDQRGRRKYFTMGREEELAKEIKALEAQLREREASLPAHSVRPEQLLAIEELETTISEKKRQLDRIYAKAADGKTEGERS
jgi:hypothetical protein